MAEGEGGGKLKLILILVLFLVIIGVGGAAAWFFLTSGDDAGAVGASVAPAAKQSSAIIENPVFLPLGSFTVNLADGRRFLKTNLELMLSEETTKIYLEQRMAEVKDLIISELQTLSTEQLRDPSEREQFKQRILNKVESLLPTKDTDWEDPRPIKKVLVTEFLLQ